MSRMAPPRLPLAKHCGVRTCAFHRTNPDRIPTELGSNPNQFPSESQTKPDRKLLAAAPIRSTPALYGLFHGVLLAVCELWQKKSRFHKRHKDGRVYRCALWAVTMAAVFFGFALFSGQVTGAVTGGAW
jgi:hypothetical protein